MQVFMINFKANQTKDKIMNKLDAAIKETKAEMETSIANNENPTLDKTVRLSQKLDPLIAHKERMLLYGC